MSSRDWSRVDIYDYDKHEELLSRTLSMSFKYQVKYFKSFLSRNDATTWDKDVVDYIKQKVAYYSPEYSKKIIKRISKLKTAENQYDITQNPTYEFIKGGYCDNPHSYKQPIKTEKLWTSYTPSKSKTTYSASTQPSSKSSTTYRTNTTSKKDTYYVGQDLGEGYVFAVNDTGTHGLIVTKSYNTSKPDSKLKYGKAATKYKWRLPTVNELYRIGKTLKDKFPFAGYLAYDGLFKCVNFSKKHVYTSNINFSYTYRVLYVAEF